MPFGQCLNLSCFSQKPSLSGVNIFRAAPIVETCLPGAGTVMAAVSSNNSELLPQQLPSLPQSARHATIDLSSLGLF